MKKKTPWGGQKYLLCFLIQMQAEAYVALSIASLPLSDFLK